MMLHRYVLAGATVSLLLTGCVLETEQVSFFFRDNTTNAKKADDLLNCEVEATQRVPVNTQLGTTPVFTTPTYVTPMYTNCYGYSCTTTGGTITGGQTYGGDVYSYDSNARLRDEVGFQCMQRKGYQVYPARTCTASETPEGLSASMSDNIIKPNGSFCVVTVASRVGVPVSIE